MQLTPFVKALGQGLSIPLNRFDVSAGSPFPAILTDYEGVLCETTRWSLQKLDLGTEYVGAVAVERDTPQLYCWDWQDSETIAVPSLTLFDISLGLIAARPRARSKPATFVQL